VSSWDRGPSASRPRVRSISIRRRKKSALVRRRRSPVLRNAPVARQSARVAQARTGSSSVGTRANASHGLCDAPRDVARSRDEPLTSGTRPAPFLRTALRDARASRGRPTSVMRRVPHVSALRSTSAWQTELEGEVRQTVDALHGPAALVKLAAVVLDKRDLAKCLRGWDRRTSGRRRMGRPTWSRRCANQGPRSSRFLYSLRRLDRGTTAATVLPDIPKTYATTIGAYRPRDYDRRYRGPVRAGARGRLPARTNVPAVELGGRGLVRRACCRRCISPASRHSIATPTFIGLGLALGKRGCHAHRARERISRAWRTAVSGGNGPGDQSALGTKARGESRRVVSPVARCDRARHPDGSRGAHAPDLDSRRPFDFPFPVAVKTGTSRHFHGQLGGRHDTRVHRRGVGRQLQWTSDGGRERSDRSRSAASSRDHGGFRSAFSRALSRRQARPVRVAVPVLSLVWNVGHATLARSSRSGSSRGTEPSRVD